MMTSSNILCSVEHLIYSHFTLIYIQKPAEIQTRVTLFSILNYKISIMKSILKEVCVFLIIGAFLPQNGFAQEKGFAEIQYEVKRIYPPISIFHEKLKFVESLADLNGHYTPSWVREFISVEISTIHDGVARKSKSKNDLLTQEQKNNINSSDLGSDILVKVNYIPENTLTHNDPKELNFTVNVIPENEAEFPGGKVQLSQYIKESVVDRIRDDVFKQYQLAAVKFTINNGGQIENVYISYSSEDQLVDELLLESICNMPIWKPAKYSNGLYVDQEFALIVGDMESCAINLLNIYQDRFAKKD